jgi:8-oxo-dGTP pyrophosphatase MutT (NUDIX family)
LNKHEYPHLTVAAVIEHNGKFLLVEEHTNDRVVFNQPAGHLELNESLLDAVKRETSEETGYLFTPQAIVGIYLLKAENGITYCRFCFCGNVIQPNQLMTLDKEIIQTHWLSRDEIIQKGEQIRSPLVLKSIDDYVKGQRYPLEMLHYLNTQN